MATITRRTAFACAAAFAGGTLARPAVLRAQERPLRIVVPFAPGGAADYVARIVAKELTEAGLAKAIVDNKPGANGIIGVDAVAKAPPDGTTIVLSALGALTINPHLQPVPYAPLLDLAPISLAVINPLTIVVRKDLPATSIAELIALAKGKPGKLTAGTSGAGSVLHVALELLNQKAGVDITHVPYKGEGPAASDLVNGQIDMAVLTIVSVQAHVNSGAIRVIAVTGGKRAFALPQVATIAEQGVAGYEAEAWNAFLAPGKTPPEIIAKLNKDITGILKRPAVLEGLRQRGSEVVASTPEEFTIALKRDFEKYGALAKSANIKLD